MLNYHTKEDKGLLDTPNPKRKTEGPFLNNLVSAAKLRGG